MLRDIKEIEKRLDELKKKYKEVEKHLERVVNSYYEIFYFCPSYINHLYKVYWHLKVMIDAIEWFFGKQDDVLVIMDENDPFVKKMFYGRIKFPKDIKDIKSKEDMKLIVDRAVKGIKKLNEQYDYYSDKTEEGQFIRSLIFHKMIVLEWIIGIDNGWEIPDVYLASDKELKKQKDEIRKGLEKLQKGGRDERKELTN